MRYRQGDIVLLPYPYTDLSATKQRPAVVISKDAINRQNYIVAKVTSVIRSDDFSFAIKAADVDSGRLDRSSEVRTNEVFTVHSSLIKKKFGTLHKEPLAELTEKIKDNITVER